MVFAFVANKDHIPNAAYPFCHVGIAGQELLLAPRPDLDVNQRVGYEATAGPVVGASGYEVVQPKLASNVEAAQICRDVSGDTIRQLIRGLHNSAIRGYDRLWI